jgi:hypothetical protein
MSYHGLGVVYLHLRQYEKVNIINNTFFWVIFFMFYSVQHLTIRRLKCVKNVYEWGKTKDKLQVIAKFTMLILAFD